MAGILSAYGEAAVITALTTGSTYVSLHTGDPGVLGTANEVSGGSYARQTATFTNSGSNPTVASNSSIITYPVATALWGAVSWFGIWDAVTSGNFRGSGTMATSKTVNIGDTARFAANALTITVD